MQTLLILGSEKAVNQFLGAKSGPVVLGQDLSLGKKLGFDVIDDTNIFNHREVITHSIQDGHLVDWSLIGMTGSLIKCLLYITQIFSVSKGSRSGMKPVTLHRVEKHIMNSRSLQVRSLYCDHWW